MSDFLNYLENHYYDDLAESLRHFVVKNREDLIFDRFDVSEASDIFIESLNLKSCSIEDKGGNLIEFDISCEPEVDFTGYHVRGKCEDEDSFNDRWFTITCRCCIGKDSLYDFKVLYVDFYCKSKKERPLTDKMIPVIKASEYEKYANGILSKYGMDSELPDMGELAKRMGFGVLKHRIKQDHSIFGETYFEACKAKLWNDDLGIYEEVAIPKNTIVVDLEATNLYSYGCEQTTLAHECIHAELHKKAYYFARAIGAISDGTLDCHGSSKDSKFLELQANGIAPYLLFPTEKLKKRYNELIDDYANLGFDIFEQREQAVRDLSKEFGVTIYSIKKRLIDLGYDSLKGICNYVDGKKIRSFGFAHGSLKSNETFILTAEDISKSFKDPKSRLPILLFSGEYIFVENFLILNDDRFWEYDKNREPILSEYARYNLEICAIKFKSSSKFRGQEDLLLYPCLPRNAVNLGLELALDDSQVDYKRLNEVNALVSKTMKEISGMSFGEAITHIMEVDHISVEEITDLPDDEGSISARTLSRYRNGKTSTIPKNTAIAICIALDVRPVISIKLLELAGIKLTASKEDTFYQDCLTSYRKYKLEKLNKMCIVMGFEPLTKNN